jgi:hypothetical protein
MGRRTKYWPERYDKIFEQLSIGMSRKDACTVAGISQDTFYKWMKRPEFSVKVLEAEFKCKQRAIMNIHAAMRTDWKAASWWLERKHHDEYGRHDTIEHSGPNGGPIKTQEQKRVILVFPPGTPQQKANGTEKAA